MNKHCYRLVFSKARGMLIAVAEICLRPGKARGKIPGSSADNTGSLNATLRLLVFFAGGLLGGVMPFGACAHIIVDPTAPGARRPTVLLAQNGVPLVNIQTPGSTGVSRNTWRQFDVQQQGVILNNSRTSIQTQLGGFIQGNPWLATGGARVILNEINSNNPSLLRGYMEVAGPRAQVIIANPSGVTCDGCGFINTNRASLTTGAPLMNGGNLDRYRVQGGTVTITGSGLDASTTDYTDIIARAAQINAGIWAKQVKIITGTQHVSVDPISGEGQVSGAITGTGPAPAFAIDTALLGGMYVGKITLIATEEGVGVRHAGKLYTRAGEVVITAAGRLENSGHLSDSGNLQPDMQNGEQNTGILYAQGTTTVVTRGAIHNSGIIATRGDIRLTSSSLDNQGTINGRVTLVEAQTLHNLGHGKIYGDHIAIDVTTLANAARDGSAPVIAARDRLDIGVSTLNNQEHALLFSGGDIALGGGLDARQRATGQAGTLNNDSATIEAIGEADIRARTINNRNRHFSTTTEQLPTQAITEYQGSGSARRYIPGTPGVSIYDDESDHLHTPEGNHEQWSAYRYTRSVSETRIAGSDPARIISGKAMTITAETLNNDKSHILAGGMLTENIHTLNNVEVSGERVITDAGHVTAYWRDQKRGRDNTGSSMTGYHPPRVIQPMLLTPTMYRQNTASEASDTQIEKSVPVRIEQPSDAVRVEHFITPITQVVAGNSSQASVVRTGDNIRLPDNNRLFGVCPDPTAHYLIETDPAFAHYHTWLSSDYMLRELALDPVRTQKRLGDGFHEQKLLREQVAQLTGRRFLQGYASDEAQYAALMNNGITQAQRHNLIPGIALSATQMAALTSDIVWLVGEDIILADGTTTRALVPRLYVHVQEGDLQAGGALMAGNDLNLSVTGNLLNRGTIAGRHVVSLNAENVINLGGRIVGSDIDITAGTDLTNLGGTLAAHNRLHARAGRDLNVVSTTGIQSNAQGSHSNLNRVAGLYVTGGEGTLLASAGRDASFLAARIRQQGKGDTRITAGNNLSLGTVTESHSNRIVWNSNNHRREASKVDTGTRIHTQSDLSLQAGQDLNARAAHVTSSQGKVLATAGHNVNLMAGEARVQVDEAHQHKGRSSAFSSKTITTRDRLRQTNARATTFSGRTTTVLAGQNINVEGSNIVSDSGTTLFAQHNLNITAVTGSTVEGHFREEKKSGLFGSGGLGVTAGTQKHSTDQQGSTRTAVAATVGSTQGDIHLQAGKNYAQTGSAVLGPRGHIDVAAKNIDIHEARETSQRQTNTTFNQSGITVAVSSPVVSALEAAGQMKSAASQTSDPRLQALAAGTTVLTAKNTLDAVQAKPSEAGGINLNISLGSTRQQSNTTQTSHHAAGSELGAGRDINLRARGAGQDSNIKVQASRVNAGNDIVLEAENDVTLLAAQNRSAQRSSNKSASSSAGVSVGTDGLLFTASASSARGKADGSELNWSHTQVEAGNQVAMASGADTTIKGGMVKAPRVTTDVGGDFNVESLQDTDRFDSEQHSLGGSISAGYGSIAGSLNAGRKTLNSDYASVTEQSGIRAGDEGFEVSVAGNTDLKGGAITSTQKAIDDNKNSFSTAGTLTTRDIQNQASYRARSVEFSAGTGMSLGGSFTPQNTGAGTGQDSGNANSTTQAAISGMAGNKEARTNDAETGIARIFDADRVQKHIHTWARITQAFGRNASRAIGDYASVQLRKAFDAHTLGKIRQRQAMEADADGQVEAAAALQAEGEEALIQAQNLRTQWGESGYLRLAAHAFTGALTGGTGGATGAAAGTLTAPVLNRALNEAGVDMKLKKPLIVLAGTLMGAGVGGAAGAASALNEVANNYLTHNKLTDEESELQRLKESKTKGQCHPACQKRILELEALDRQRDATLETPMKHCEAKADSKNCKTGAVIARQYDAQGSFVSESMRWESNPGTRGSPFSFNDCFAQDKGGCSYGPLQIASDNGMVANFLQDLKNNPSTEAQSFYKALQAAGGARAAASKSTNQNFLNTWMRLTTEDPQFVQYQIDTLINRNLYPNVAELKQSGIDFNALSAAQKRMLVSAAVQHGSGTEAKHKGLDNLLERTFAQADIEMRHPPLPTYTRQNLVYGEVEEHLETAEKEQARLIRKRENFITQRENFITQRENFITQQLQLERQKNTLLEQGLKADAPALQQIRGQVKALDHKIGAITPRVAQLTAQMQGLTTRVDSLTRQVKEQDRFIREAGEYLKEKAKEELRDGEKFIKDFYKARTEMYPSEAGRYRVEMESILKQYREEQKQASAENKEKTKK